MAQNQSKNIAYLVFQGGGVKGLVHIGAMEALEEYFSSNSIEVGGYAGTSVGAIIASLFAVGYSAKDIKEFFTKDDGLLKILLPFKIYKYLKLPFILLNPLHSSFINNKNLKNWLEKKLSAKIANNNGKVTFGNIFDETGKHLRVFSTDITTKQLIHYNYDDYKKESVVEAVIRSACIPLVFRPRIDGESLFYDGGILDNFPIHAFDDLIEKYKPNSYVYGFSIATSEAKKAKNNVISLGMNFFKTVIEGRVHYNYEYAKWKNYYVKILCTNLSLFDVDAKKEEIEKEINLAKLQVEEELN